MAECKVEKEQEPRLLPVLQLHGKEFFVDVEKTEFRDVNDLENVNMHSDEERQMVRKMAGMEWLVFRVDREQAKASEV